MNQLSKVKNVLVTGAAGFIGSHCSKFLLEKNINVFGIDNLNDYYDVHLKEARLEQLKSFDNFKFTKVELNDFEKLKLLFETFKPEVVVHLAAQAGVRYSLQNPLTYADSNLSGFVNILECCRHYAVKHFVFASSSSVYGANAKVPFAESDTVDCPISLYAATKRANELMAYTYSHLFKIPSTALRFFSVYGEWGRPDMAYFKFTKAILNNQPIDVYAEGNLERDFTYVGDVVNAIYQILYVLPETINNAPYKIYNVGNHEPCSVKYFIQVLEKLIGKQAVINYLPMQDGDVPKTYADISAIQKVINFTPETSLESGLQRFVDWYKNFYPTNE
ncbi:MAG: hypothetical protein BGO32_12185 [Bacteroidetes bacterium 37-13]|nr:MAG: hypothetical protein BGO32_12185 [Bacteroidetes bacterium 37-13]